MQDNNGQDIDVRAKAKKVLKHSADVHYAVQSPNFAFDGDKELRLAHALDDAYRAVRSALETVESGSTNTQHLAERKASGVANGTVDVTSEG